MSMVDRLTVFGQRVVRLTSWRVVEMLQAIQKVEVIVMEVRSITDHFSLKMHMKLLQHNIAVKMI